MESKIKIIAAVVLQSLLAVLLWAQSELPLHQKKLSERALIIWTGDYMQTIATVALATRKGIVAIDTSLIRSDDARIRQAIEKDFPYFKDRRLEARGTNLHMNNIEAIWERIAKQ